MKNPSPPNIVTVAVLTTITVIFWIFFGVYSVLTSEAVVNIPPDILAPINPTLDQDTLGKLDERIFFKKGETVEFIKNPEQSDATPKPAESIPVPTEEFTETLVPSEVASPEADLEI